MYDNGTKSPHSIKKTPKVVNVKTLFLKIRKSGKTLPPGRGGKRDRMRMLANTSKKQQISAMTSVAYRKPMRGKRACSINGKTIPPKLPPAAAMPVAFARRVKKKCAIEAIAGVKISEVPRPQRIEKVRMKCQSSTASHIG